VAAQLAVLDDVSGLLAATRLANAGQLDVASLAGAARQVSPGLRLLTGLPRPDRWTEVRPSAFAELLDVARALDELVVVDCGFALAGRSADPFADGPSRDDMTGTALAEADVVVAVGAADPVGLTRLARTLPELVEASPEAELHVVVNRMRPSLGWSREEVTRLVAGVLPQARIWFLPEDRPAADRAVVSGRTLVECGDSALRRAIAEVTGALLPEPLLPEPMRPGRTSAGRRGRALRRRRLPATVRR
jgi:hypothetical protein